MFFHKRTGWGIAFRIFMVLLLIGGVVAITRGAFYKGYSIGASQSQNDISMFKDGRESFTFHDPSGTMFHKSYPGGMYQQGYPGSMYYPSHVNFGGAALHILFGILGLFILGKIFMGFTGMGMYHRRMMYRDPDGKGYGPYPPFFHHPHFGWHHRYYDENYGNDEAEEEAPDPAVKGKTKKKKS